MDCSEIFWAGFFEVFPKMLAFSLGALPAALAFWGGMAAVFGWNDRRERAQNELRYGLGARMDRLEERLREIQVRRIG
jgi:hypothetical protein